MFKVPQTEIDRSIIPYVLNELRTEVKRSVRHYKH